MKEYSTLIIRERYSFIKTLFISFSIILDICHEKETYKSQLFKVILIILIILHFYLFDFDFNFIFILYL